MGSDHCGEGQRPQLLIKGYRRRLGQILTGGLIWIEKKALPWLPATFEWAFLGQRPLVIDFDDPWYLRAMRAIRTHSGPRAFGKQARSVAARAIVGSRRLRVRRGRRTLRTSSR
jgi:hypothetical protein